MKSKIAKKIKFDRFDIVILGIFVAFFSALLIIGEPIYVSDTYQYDNQMVMREPGYALLLQITRFIAPQNYYEVVIVIQNILPMITNAAFIIYLRKNFKLNYLVTLLFSVIMLAPHIMTPLCSHTHLILTNSLMTEAVLFSLYPLFIMCIIDAVKSGNPVGKESLKTVLFCLAISLIRGQMMVLFFVWFITMIIIALFKDNGVTLSVKAYIKSKGRIILSLSIIMCSLFICRSAVSYVYNYLESGIFVDTVSREALSFANVLYAADREDGEAIEDEVYRNLFYEMYDAADRDKMNYKYAEEGLLNRAIHHEACHDELNFTYFGDPAKRYVAETKNIYIDQFQKVIIEIDKVAAVLAKELMPVVLDNYVENYIAIAAQGFIRTVSYTHPVFAWYSVCIYLFAIIVTIILWKKNSRSIPARFMAIILLAIVGNVCATALMVQCISRYMLYNMPMFYIAGILELIELWNISKNKIES